MSRASRPRLKSRANLPAFRIIIAPMNATAARPVRDQGMIDREHLPLGTILGVFTFIVLSRESVARACADAAATLPG